MKYMLGVDLGTSGTKTVLFDQAGRSVASAAAEYPMRQPCNGWAEQDPADWHHAAVETIRAVMEQSGVAPQDVVSLGIAGQMHGLVMLDGDGRVLRPPSSGATSAPRRSATRLPPRWARTGSSASPPTRR